MSQLLRYLIVDDDEIDRMALEAEASKFPFLVKTASCSHPLEAFAFMTGFPVDIVFADIEMPGMTGLELIRRLTASRAATVFITAHPEFALAGYDSEAFDYLIKPIVSERFARCAYRLRDFFRLRSKAYAFDQEQESGSIVIKQGYEQYKIGVSEIVYLEAMKDYTRIVTGSRPYLVLSTLCHMQERLPKEKFVRIHRSYVVNRDKILAVKNYHRIQLPSQELPVGKLYKNVLKGIFP